MRRALVNTCAAIVAAILSLGFANAAYADDDPGKVASGASSSPANDRSAVVSLKPGTSHVAPRVIGSGGHINGYHGVTITPPGGLAGTFAQGFGSNYSSGCSFSCTINVSSGSSYARWLGSTPYNASSVGLTDHVWVGGVNISISVGASPSAGVSVANNTVTMSSSVGNNWHNEHSFSNIRFSTYVAMWGPYENSSDSATFGYMSFYDNIT